jgi:RNA polymerase sigma-70 factor, ECF subfamily
MPGDDPFRNPERLIRRVYSYVAYRVGEGPEAEDLTSEAIERAFCYRDSYDPAKGSAAAWVIGIARRCVVEARSAPHSLANESDDLPSGLDLEAQTGRRLLLAGALQTLGEADRELIALRYGADLTARQIAEQLGLRTNAVEVALHRALAKLRAALEDRDDRAAATPPPHAGHVEPAGNP